MILSTLCRYLRQVLGFDDDHNARVARGEPHPVGSGGNSIWLGFVDGKIDSYLITKGAKPVAAVWLDRFIPQHPYRAAMLIAADPQIIHERGDELNASLFVGDEKLTLFMLEGATFFPADRRGEKRLDCPHYGVMYLLDNGHLATCTMLQPGSRPVAVRQVPTFEMNIDGWAPVPKKKAVRTTIETLSPGQLERIESEVVTAA